MAEEMGAFARQGLEIEFLAGGPGKSGAGGAVAIGEADIGVASDLLAVLDEIATGDPLRVVAATMGVSPLGIAALDSFGPVSMQALSGRRIGAGTDADQAVLDALFAINDLTPDYEFVAIGGGIDELESGAADAICCSTISQPPAAERRGVRLHTATFAALGLPMPADVVVVSDRFLAEHRQAVVGFLRAMAQGWAEVVADPQRGAQVAHNRFGAEARQDLADAIGENDSQLPFVCHGQLKGDPMLWIDLAELGESLRRLEAAGVPELPAAHDLVDLGPIRDALDTR